VKSCRIKFCPNHEWASYFPIPLGVKAASFQGVLIHELLHTLGLDHPENCNEDVASALTPGFLPSLESTHLFEGDATALRAIYDNRPQVALSFQSTDGVTWQPGVAPPAIIGASALHSPAGCGAGTGSPIVVSYTQRIDHAVQFTRFDGLSWATPKAVRTAVTPYPTASACASDQDQVIVWQGDYNKQIGNAFLFKSRTLDGGGSWIHERFGDTSAPGVAAAFDPASQRYVTVVRTGGAGQLVSQVLSDGPPTFHALGTLAMRSSEIPSLACGDPAVVGARNCLLAWVSTDWDRFLWYAFGQVKTTANGPVFAFDTTGLGVTPIVLFGTPSVTYVPGAKLPWQLVSHQGNGAVIALERSTNQGQLWQPAPPATFTPGNSTAITSPTGASLTAARALARFTFFLSGLAQPKLKALELQDVPVVQVTGGFTSPLGQVQAVGARHVGP
jgi:hypothetical protein